MEDLLKEKDRAEYIKTLEGYVDDLRKPRAERSIGDVDALYIRLCETAEMVEGMEHYQAKKGIDPGPKETSLFQVGVLLIVVRALLMKEYGVDPNIYADLDEEIDDELAEEEAM